MKKALCLIMVLCGLLAGCAKEEKQELTVFAAASMTETLTELGDIYMSENPDVSIVFNFDSSGTLKTQIEEGADCDVFISAGQKQMDMLNSVEEGSRFNILENKVALAVPEGNPANIQSYEDLRSALEKGEVLLAMGNGDVPVGQYTQRILAFFGLDEAELVESGCITYGSNAKEVTTQVAEAVVDCGIIYQTDAASAGLTVVDTATAEICGQVIYPAAIIDTSESKEAANNFLEFLKSDTADAVFEAVGFTPIA